MQLALHGNSIPLTRQEQLEIWLKRNKTSYAALARCIGMTRQGMRNLLHGDTAPSDRVTQLRAVVIDGQRIPEELLPSPLYLKPGPKPGVSISLSPT